MTLMILTEYLAKVATNVRIQFLLRWCSMCFADAEFDVYSMGNRKCTENKKLKRLTLATLWCCQIEQVYFSSRIYRSFKNFKIMYLVKPCTLVKWVHNLKILVRHNLFCTVLTRMGTVIIKIVATRCQILRLKCTKFDFAGAPP